MRRSLCLLTLLFAFLTPVPVARGGDSEAGSDAPTVDQLLERILSSDEAEHAMVAQYLRQADAETVFALFAKVRQAMRPEGDEPKAPDLREVVRRLREGEPEAQVALIEVTARILEVGAQAQADIAREMETTVRPAGTVLDAVATARLERALAGRPGVRELTTPKVSMLAGQPASISVLNQMSYVAGYDLVRRAGGEVADPRVGTLQDGMVLRLRAERGGAEGAVRLRLAGTWAEVVKPLGVCEAPVGTAGGKVKIQVPHTRLTCRDVDLLLPQGSSALVRGGDRGAGGAQWLQLEARLREVGASFLGDVLGEAPQAPEPAPVPGGLLVTIEARVIEVASEKATRVLGSEPGPGDVTLTYLDDAQVAALLARIEAEEDAQVVSAPRLTAYDGQSANVSMLSEVSYVKDVEVEVLPDGSRSRSPVVGVLQEGLVLDLKPSLGGDRERVTVEIDGRWAEVQRPIPEHTVVMGGQEITIQLPEMVVRRSQATVRLHDGGSVLVRPERAKDGPKESALLVRAQVVDLHAEEGRPLDGDK